MKPRHAAALALVGWYLIDAPTLAFARHAHADFKNDTFEWGIQDYLGLAILLLVVVGLVRGVNTLHLLRELRKIIRKSK